MFLPRLMNFFSFLLNGELISKAFDCLTKLMNKLHCESSMLLKSIPKHTDEGLGSYLRVCYRQLC
jgi:hypothetical protein